MIDIPTRTNGLAQIEFSPEKPLILRTNTLPGIDVLHPKVLYSLATELAPVIVKFFQRLL
jgi:hypothetical protein